MRWLYTAIIASSALLMLGEAIGQTVDVSRYGATPDSDQNSSAGVARAVDFALRHHRSKILFKRGRYDFWPQGAVIRHLLSQTMMEWPSVRLAYSSNTATASNLMATDRNLCFMIPCFLLLFRIQTG